MFFIRVKHLCLLTAMSLGFTSLADCLAELHDCNGVWTNKPCSASQEETSQSTQGLIETTSPETSSDQDMANEEMNKKSDVYQELSLNSSKARRLYDVKVDLDEARKSCLETTDSLDECRKVVEKIQSKLDSKIEKAEALSLKKKELELKEKEIKSRKETDGGQNTYITINKNKISKVPPRDYHHRVPTSSFQTSVQVQGSQGSASFSINEQTNQAVPSVGVIDSGHYEEDHPHHQNHHRPEPLINDRPAPPAKRTKVFGGTVKP